MSGLCKYSVGTHRVPGSIVGTRSGHRVYTGAVINHGGVEGKRKCLNSVPSHRPWGQDIFSPLGSRGGGSEREEKTVLCDMSPGESPS